MAEVSAAELAGSTVADPSFNKRRLRWRRILLMVWDICAWLIAFLAFTLIRTDVGATSPLWLPMLSYALLAAAMQLGAGLFTGLYRGRARIGSFDEAGVLGVIVVAISVVLTIGFLVVFTRFSGMFLLTVPALALLIMAAGRWVFRGIFKKEWAAKKAASGPRAIVYGAGDGGHGVARLVDTAVDRPYEIVGFVDDDVEKRLRRVRGYRVLGTGADLSDLIRAHNAEVVILAITGASAELSDRVSTDTATAGAKLVIVPPIREMIGGRVDLKQLRELNVADLLGRRPIKTDLSQIAGYLTGKVVLITGAGGSIGSELARQVHKLGPAKLLLLDRDETGLHTVQLSIYGVGLLDTDDMILCDIRDERALLQVFEKHRPQVVFHAAALKHLPMLEQYPAEGWKTNSLGTLNVLKCAREVGVDRFVNISTDKAADATSVLGQTKRIAERLTAWFAMETGRKYLSVRFGNVLGSRGSVLHTFRTQINQGGPITVTHPDITRYFMTIPEACELVLQAGAIGDPADVLVLDMGEPVKIIDVARRLIAESHRDDIEVRFTGLREGEKLHEVLFSGLERGAPSPHPLITRVSVPALPPERLGDAPDSKDGIVRVMKVGP